MIIINVDFLIFNGPEFRANKKWLSQVLARIARKRIQWYFSGMVSMFQKIGVNQNPNWMSIATNCPISLKNTITEDAIHDNPNKSIVVAKR
jgi:hypothetical protein